MADATVVVGTTATELPRDSATSLLIQNQDGSTPIRLAVAESAPATSTAGPLLRPFEWGRISDLGGNDKVYCWCLGAGSAAVFVSQEA